MNRLIKLFCVFVISIAIFSSCKKGEGEGGMATIKGKVMKKNYSPNFDKLISQNYVAEENVYIIYGDDDSYSDDIKTNYDGTYKFDYMRPGKYTLFVYSDDTTGNSLDNIAVLETITVDGKKDIVEVPDLVMADNLDYSDGTSSICGKVYVVNYNSTFTSITGEYFGPEIDVYAVYNNDNTYFERIKTLDDGSYCFNNLIIGDYVIYTYSDDSTMQAPSGKVTRIKEASILYNDQHIEVGNFRVLD